MPRTRSPIPDPRSPRRSRRASGGGFTLIEAALTTVIVGTGVLAMVAAQQAYHQKNDWATRTNTAMLLANELRELTLTLPMHDPISGTSTLGLESNESLDDVATYDDLDDFAAALGAGGLGTGAAFTPPVNALRQTVDDLTGWTQRVDVQSVLPENIAADTPQPLGTTDMMRVTVSVFYQDPQADSPQLMTTLTWVVTRR